MKRIVSIIVIVSLIAVIIAGMFLGNNIMVIGGIVALFGGSFLLSVGLLIKMVFDVKKERRMSGEDKKAAEERAKAEVNSTYGYENQIARGKRMMSHVADAWSHSSLGDKIKGMLFLLTFLTCCALFVIFLKMGKFTWGLIAWGCGVGLIVGALVVVKLAEHFSFARKRKFIDRQMASGELSTEKTTGTVTACLLSSESMSGSERTQRISRTTYKLLIDVDGEQKVTYAQRYYNEGDSVLVWAPPGVKWAVLAEDETESD